MYWSDRVKLIARTRTGLDPIGNPVFTETATEVWADGRSPTRTETASAGAMGMTATHTFRIHTSDYAGQTLVELGGRRLTVYRTFQPGPDEVELHVGEKRGETNAG